VVTRWQVITTKCFAKCVTRPGPKLDDSEKICTAKCMDRCVQQRRGLSRSRSARSQLIRRGVPHLAGISMQWRLSRRRGRHEPRRRRKWVAARVVGSCRERADAKHGAGREEVRLRVRVQ
jgi:hypothetical protein